MSDQINTYSILGRQIRRLDCGRFGVTLEISAPPSDACPGESEEIENAHDGQSHAPAESSRGKSDENEG